MNKLKIDANGLIEGLRKIFASATLLGFGIMWFMIIGGVEDIYFNIVFIHVVLYGVIWWYIEKNILKI